LVKKEKGKSFPQDAHQTAGHVARCRVSVPGKAEAVTYRRMEKIPDDIGTAAMCSHGFGNMGDTSVLAWVSHGNPSTGEKVFWGEFLINAQGEDVVAGIRTPRAIQELETPCRTHIASCAKSR